MANKEIFRRIYISFIVFSYYCTSKNNFYLESNFGSNCLLPPIISRAVIKSLKSCGLNLKMDGNKDYLIHCFKEGQPCANGLNMLKEQQNLLSNAEYLNTNPFEITESDTEEANMSNNLIDPSDSEDGLIGIEINDPPPPPKILKIL